MLNRLTNLADHAAIAAGRIFGKLLKVLVELVGPVAQRSDMEPDLFFELGSRRNGERMPLELGYGGHFNVDVVARFEFEVGRSRDYQLGHFGRKQVDIAYISPTVLDRFDSQEVVDALENVQDEGEKEPLPKVGCVYDQY